MGQKKTEERKEQRKQKVQNEGKRHVNGRQTTGKRQANGSPKCVFFTLRKYEGQRIKHDDFFHHHLF